MSLLDKIKEFVDKSQSISLAEAIEQNNESVYKEQINTSNVNEFMVEYEGRTYYPLHLSVKFSNANAAKYFLSLDASIDTAAECENGSAKLALKLVKDAKIFTLFADAGFNFNIEYSGVGEAINILEHAIKYRDTNFVKAVLARGYELESSYSPYVFAAGDEIDFAVIKLLVENGYDYNEEDEELVALACYEEVSEERLIAIVKLLSAVKNDEKTEKYDEKTDTKVAAKRAAKTGLDLDKKYENGFDNSYTLLSKAIESKYAKLVKLLVDMGADISEQRYLVAEMLSKDELNELADNCVIEETLALSNMSFKEVKNYIEEATTLANSPIVCAIFTNNNISFKQTVVLLEAALAKGADVNEEDDSEDTALRGTIVCDNLEYTKLLVENGAKLECSDEYMLFVALAYGNIACIRYLLEHANADINYQTANLDRWFYCYASQVILNKRQKRAMLDLLFEYGLDLSLKDGDDDVAVDSLIADGDVVSLEYILEKNGKLIVSKDSSFRAFRYHMPVHIVKAVLDSTTEQIDPICITVYMETFGQTAEDREKRDDKDYIKGNNYLEIFDLLVNDKNGLDINTIAYDESLLGLSIKHDLPKLTRHILANFPTLKISKESVFNALYYLEDFKLVKEILDRSDDTDIPNCFMNDVESDGVSATPIAFAVSKGKFELAKFLLDAYPDMKIYADAYKCVLLSATFSTVLDEDLFMKLLQRYPDINGEFMDRYGHYPTPAFEICNSYTNRDYKSTKLRALRLLFENGADINKVYSRTQDAGPLTPSFTYPFGQIVAWANGNFEVCKPLFDLLIEFGFNPTKPMGSHNEAPIMGAIQRFPNYMSDDTVVEMLEYTMERFPFSMDLTNSFNNTLVMSASMACYPKAVKWLIDHGAEIHAWGGFDNSHAMFKCIANYAEADFFRRMKTVEVLLDAGVDIEIEDKYDENYTPLMTACYMGAIETVKMLLARGADVEHIVKVKKSIVRTIDIDSQDDLAEGNAVWATLNAEHNYEFARNLETSQCKILRMLADNGANFNQTLAGTPLPLVVAAVRGYPNVFKILLELGADPYLIDPNMQQKAHKKVGFNRPKRADEHGTNPLGFILMNGAKEKVYLDILVDFLGKDIVVQAQKDIARFEQPIKPLAIDAKLRAEKMMADLILKAEQAEAALKERVSIEKEANPKNIEENPIIESSNRTIYFPVDEIIKRSTFMGLVNINFQISSESMVGLARSIESMLHIELVEVGEAWANLLKLIVEKRTPHIVECIDFDGVGNHFTATIDGRAEGGKEVIEELETIITALFQSEEIFVREVMLIKSELRSACSTL